MKIRNGHALPHRIDAVLDQFVERSVIKYEHHIKPKILKNYTRFLKKSLKTA